MLCKKEVVNIPKIPESLFSLVELTSNTSKFLGGGVGKINKSSSSLGSSNLIFLVLGSTCGVKDIGLILIK